MVRVGSCILLTFAIDIVEYFIFLYSASAVICNFPGLLGGSLLVFLFLGIWLEYCVPQRLISGMCSSGGLCGTSRGIIER